MSLRVWSADLSIRTIGVGEPGRFRAAPLPGTIMTTPTPPPPQPPPYPQGFAPPQYVVGPPAPGTNGLAIASMVLGILWIYWIGSILAVIFGHVALSQIKRTRAGGKGMAIAGLVLGYLGIAVLVVGIIALGAFDPNY